MKEGRLIVGASETVADLLYLTGFFAPDPFIWFEIDDKRTVIVSPMELERAREQCHSGIEVLSYDEAKRAYGVIGKKDFLVHLLVEISRRNNGVDWLVPADFPIGIAMDVHDMGAEILGKDECIEDCIVFSTTKSPFCPERQVKSAFEIEMLHEAEKIAECGLNAALEMLGEASIADDGKLIWRGQTLTSEMLKGQINGEIARHGGNASHTIAASAAQGACPHHEGTGPIWADTPIVMDIFPRSEATGYFGDLTRTVVKGKASDVVRRAFGAVHDAQRAAIDMLKPGVKGRDVHDKAAEVMASQGFATDLKAAVPYGFIHGLGHSVGLEIHESPSLNSRGTEPLVPGNVVTVEPGLYYPEWGGIRIEDLVAITEDGCRDLTSAPVFLELD